MGPGAPNSSPLEPLEGIAPPGAVIDRAPSTCQTRRRPERRCRQPRWRGRHSPGGGPQHLLEGGFVGVSPASRAGSPQSDRPGAAGCRHGSSECGRCCFAWSSLRGRGRRQSFMPHFLLNRLRGLDEQSISGGISVMSHIGRQVGESGTTRAPDERRSYAADRGAIRDTCPQRRAVEQRDGDQAGVGHAAQRDGDQAGVGHAPQRDGDQEVRPRSAARWRPSRSWPRSAAR